MTIMKFILISALFLGQVYAADIKPPDKSHPQSCLGLSNNEYQYSINERALTFTNIKSGELVPFQSEKAADEISNSEKIKYSKLAEISYIENPVFKKSESESSKVSISARTYFNDDTTSTSALPDSYRCTKASYSESSGNKLHIKSYAYDLNGELLFKTQCEQFTKINKIVNIKTSEKPGLVCMTINKDICSEIVDKKLVPKNRLSCEYDDYKPLIALLKKKPNFGSTFKTKDGHTKRWDEELDTISKIIDRTYREKNDEKNPDENIYKSFRALNENENYKTKNSHGLDVKSQRKKIYFPQQWDESNIDFKTTCSLLHSVIYSCEKQFLPSSKKYIRYGQPNKTPKATAK